MGDGDGGQTATFESTISDRSHAVGDDSILTSNYQLPLHPLKALLPIDETLLGMVIEVRPLQYSKASKSMDVTLLGIVTEDSPSHSQKADLPIDVTLYVFPPYSTVSGMTIEPEYSLL